MDLSSAPWWMWLAAFFVGPFLVNGVPHFVHGVSGKQFPTPFSGGRGTLDNPVRNVFWGAANFLAGGWLAWLIRDWITAPPVFALIIVTAIAGGAFLGYVFSQPPRPGRGHKQAPDDRA